MGPPSVHVQFNAHRPSVRAIRKPFSTIQFGAIRSPFNQYHSVPFDRCLQYRPTGAKLDQYVALAPQRILYEAHTGRIRYGILHAKNRIITAPKYAVCVLGYFCNVLHISDLKYITFTCVLFMCIHPYYYGLLLFLYTLQRQDQLRIR